MAGGMNAPDPNIRPAPAPIRPLDEAAVNRIAAGEVVMVEDNLGLRLTRVLPAVGQEFA